ncbi:MAG: hypothetical protein IJA60_01695 [Clostridia bacterium]|nr:hypothetical protein [Clostridia bacterium]
MPLIYIGITLFIAYWIFDIGNKFCCEKFAISFFEGTRLAITVITVIALVVALIYNLSTGGSASEYAQIMIITICISTAVSIAYNIFSSNQHDAPAIIVCALLGIFHGIFGTLGAIGYVCMLIIAGTAEEMVKHPLTTPDYDQSSQPATDANKTWTRERADYVARQHGATDADDWARRNGQIGFDAAYTNGWYNDKI